MQGLRLQFESASPVVLCIGAHCDDVEIGCGGTLLKIIREYPAAQLHYVALCSNSERAEEATNAAKSLASAETDLHMHLFELRDGFLPYEGSKPKELLGGVAGNMNPDLIFTHWRDDAHQDHRLVSEITRNIFRNHMILEYEIPKFDGDMGRPNVYSLLDASTMERKIEIIMSAYASQANKHWFSRETLESIARLRGIESGRDQDYAEAFYSYKAQLSI